MELDKTVAYDLSEIEALELETRALLDEVRGKKTQDKKAKGNEKVRQTSKQSSAQDSKESLGGKDKTKSTKKKLKGKDLDEAVTSKLTGSATTTAALSSSTARFDRVSSTVNLFPTSRATVEILDDASPDATPRLSAETDTDAAIAADKQRRAQYFQAESSHKQLRFSAEQSRVLSQADTFVPSMNVTSAEVHQERLRLKKIQDDARLKLKNQQQETIDRTSYLREDRAALRVQCVFRGHLGRRQAALAEKLQSFMQSENAENDESNDWIEVTDNDTGDVWYYNQRTQQSQWNKPQALEPSRALPTKKSKKSKTSQQKFDSSEAVVDPKTGTRTLAVSMSLPSLEAMKARQHQQQKQSGSQSATASPIKQNRRQAESVADMNARQEINEELRVSRLQKMEALTNPDGYFKTQLRNVVQDALLDSRFDNVSTVLADTRWFESNDELFPRVIHREGNNQGTNDQENANTTNSVPVVPARVDYSRTPMVSVFHLQTKKKKAAVKPIQAVNELQDDTLANDPLGTEIENVNDLTLNEFHHTGLEDPERQQAQMQSMCFGCWSSGINRKCMLHATDEKMRPSQTMLLCRNWHLDVMRRRYRSEEIQELFLKQEKSLRYDAKHKKFHAVVEQRHPIYRLQSQILERFNNRYTLFAKIKFWMHSMREVMRNGTLGRKSVEIASMRRLVLSLLHHSRVDRFSQLNKAYLPIAPITGYSWPERQGEEQYLFQHKDNATGQLVDIIRVDPMPVPKKLYLPREYHLPLPKTVPLPQGGFSEELAADGTRVAPANRFIADLHPASWLERICSNIVKDGALMAAAQVKAIMPVAPVEVLNKAKRPPPSTIKFATIGQKPTPGNMAIGGLPAEMLIYQVISTHFPPQYGNMMVMDKASVSPAVSPEVMISFESIVMPPTLEEYVERPLDHPLTYRRPPTIALNSFVTAKDKHVYGLNRPEQTGEQESHGFRTTTWAPQLQTFEDIDPQVFVPGQTVVSLNTPKANTSCTTHADYTYPFCEPSTRDNSTLDFYHLLLQGVVSSAKAQIFTALTVQEPGQFQKNYNIDGAMGQLVISVYRSWGFTQQDTIQEFKTDDGVSYWYHRKTGQTFWQRPLYESEEASPLLGGTILDQLHDEEPSTMVKGEDGAVRRYTQGEFRKNMLMHLETKKDAMNRRRAAAATVSYAKERGILPNLSNPSMMNNFGSSAEVVPQIGFADAPHSSLLATEASSAAPFGVSIFDHSTNNHDTLNIIRMQDSQKKDQLMDMYDNSGIQHMNQNMTATNRSGQAALGPTSGVHLEDSQMLPSATSASRPPLMPSITQSLQRPGSSSVPMGMDPAFMNQLSASLGNMFSMMMNMDNAKPQDMIQLGLGMGMALMQTGMVNNLVEGQVQNEVDQQHLQTIAEESVDLRAVDPASGLFPTMSEAEFSKFQDEASVSQQSRPSRVSTSDQLGPAGPEPIGRFYPTAIMGANKTLDHSEEQAQRMQMAERFQNPLTTMEQARNLKIEPTATETPDVAPPKVLTDVRPSNYEDELRENLNIPVLAYPELSTQVPGGPPVPYSHKQPAGMGTSFVSHDQAESQLRVPGSETLRRTVMPLPVGFFEAIEAKHVAKQAVDYLPQVPNLPQSRTIGRVKPRSAAADWLMISFDPWSAGKNPLGTEFVASLMEKADRLLGANAADALDSLRQSTMSGAFINVMDEEGLAQQRAEITKAQVLSNDFKKLCSLCRHSKFADAEQLINQPDWSVPIDFQDDQGNTLLHVACQNGSKRLVKLCLRRGASLSLQNLNGQTALHFAFGYGYAEVGEYLVSKGADDSLRNKDGLTCYEGLGARELALL